MSEIELAWAAGFFDGEGNSNSSGRTFAMRISQVHREVLDRFCAAVGAGKVYGPYPAKQENRQPQYRYEVAGLSARQVYEKLRPFLGTVKKEQADKAAAWYDATITRHCIPPNTRVEIQQLYEQHTDPLIGAKRRGGKIHSKAISFCKKFPTRWNITPGGLYQLVKKMDKGTPCQPPL
jgi:hypothetical protein